MATPITYIEHADLTFLAQQYKNARFVGQRLLPLITINNKRVRIPVYGADAMRVYSTKRAIYARSNMAIAEDAKSILVELQEHDLEFPIDLKQTEANEIQAKRRRNTMLAQEGIELSLENSIAEIAQDVTTYPENHRFTLTGTDQWNDYVNSDPIDDIEQMKMAIKSETGRTPNIILMGSKVFDTVKNHPKLQTTNTLNQKFPATPESLAIYFGVKEVIVGEAIYHTGSGFNDIWGKTVIVAYVNATTTEASVEEMSFGYTLRLKGYPKTDTYQSNPGKVEQTRNTDTVIPFITSGICGAILTGVIA